MNQFAIDGRVGGVESVPYGRDGKSFVKLTLMHKQKPGSKYEEDVPVEITAWNDKQKHELLSLNGGDFAALECFIEWRKSQNGDRFWPNIKLQRIAGIIQPDGSVAAPIPNTATSQQTHQANADMPF